MSITVLLVDPDPHARAALARQIESLGCRVLETSGADEALDLLRQSPVSLVITELYLATGEHPCLIAAIRHDDANRATRIVAHTHRSLAADRDWAMRAGADGYLIKPTRGSRVRYVVQRLTSPQRRSMPSAAERGTIMRRDSLDAALEAIEVGALTDASCIVFGRAWWERLTGTERSAYRTRARRAHVTLRSDSMIGTHFVEVRGRSRENLGLSTERPESPYRP